MLRKSFVYNKLISPFRSLSEEDVKLFLAMVDQSREAAKLQHPESEFHVILWDNMFRHTRQPSESFHPSSPATYVAKEILQIN